MILILLKMMEKRKNQKRFETLKITENNKTYTVKVYHHKCSLNSIKIKLSSGRVYYYKNRIHRELGPAVEGRYKAGKLGNDFLPYGNIKVWVQNGKIHNDFGPAFKYENNGEFLTKYVQNGKLHRINGPALIWDDKKDSGEEFYVNGKKLPHEEAKTNTNRLNRLNWIFDSPEESPFKMLKV